MDTMIESPLAHLTDEQIEELGKEFDAIHDEVYADLGDRDRRYITSMIEMHRRLLVMSRLLLLASRHRPAYKEKPISQQWLVRCSTFGHQHGDFPATVEAVWNPVRLGPCPA